MADMRNAFRISGDTTYILIKGAGVCRISTEDLPVVSHYTWHKKSGHSGFYAGATFAIGSRRTGREIRHVKMHRLILNPPDALTVDHINHDTLDNRRQNLRAVTAEANAQNRRGADRDNGVGIRGISKREKGTCRWYVAQIQTRRATAKKLFPQTHDGLEQASAWVTRTRLELMPSLPPQ